MRNKEKRKQYEKKYREEHKQEIAQYREEHKEEKAQYNKKYQEEYKNEIAERKKKYNQEHKEETAEWKRKYNQEHREEIAERNKKYREEHKEEKAQYEKEHKQEIAQQKRKYNQEHKKERNQHRRAKYNTNSLFRLNDIMSTAVRQVKNPSIKKGRSWKQLVPYTLTELRKHLKSTLPKGYTWKDFMQGKLHIDHILPKAIFQYEKAEDIAFQICWGLDNLRLLPSEENLSKGKKLIKPFQKHFSIEVEVKNGN